MPNASSETIIEEYADKYPPLLVAKQAAEIAGVPVATIHAWSSAGKLDSFKHRQGRKIRLVRDQFVRYLLGQN